MNFPNSSTKSTKSANAYIDTHAKFDDAGNRTESTDTNNCTTVTAYDSTYNAYPETVTTCVPDSSGTNGSDVGFVTTATFDPITGLPETITNANGLVTETTYDPVTLRPTLVKTAKGTANEHHTQMIYDDANNKVTTKTQIDPSNWAESVAYYDGLGRTYKTKQVHSDGDIFVNKEFDAEGRVKQVSNPYRLSNDDCYQGGQIVCWTTNTYDDASRVIKVTLPDGSEVLTDYGVSTSGKIGTTKQITDQAGKKRKGINDALGRMIRVIEDPDTLAYNTDYTFDTLGNLRKTVQGVQSRYFMHDSLGRLLYAKQPEQDANAAFTATDSVTNNTDWSVKYEYDDNGNIEKTTDARGVYVEGVYDKFNRITYRNYSDTTPDVNFYYDGEGIATNPGVCARGQTTRIESTVSETRYTSYDVSCRLKTHEQVTQGETYQTAYTYNLSGAMIEETYPSLRKVKYDLNSDGELEKLESKRDTMNDYKLYLDQITRNTVGAIEKMRLGNGTWETASYNDRQQVTQIALGSSETTQNLLKIEYDYGTPTQNNGSLRQQKVNFAGLSNELVQDYTYDDLNRLKSATETPTGSSASWQQTFDYDRYGNRVFNENNTDTYTQWTKVTNPTIETSNNRLTENQDGGAIDYDYDNNGNLTLDAENKRFIYNAENQIKGFFRGSNGTSTPDATYEYDGDGKRVRKIADSVETIFVYNASGQLVAEYSNQMPEEPKASYLTADHLGSPRIVTDGIGAVVSRHDYMAFGDEVTQTVGNVGGRSSSQGYGEDDEIRKGYTGYEKDTESGLEFAQARYYNSMNGRFTSVDPLTASASIRDPQTFNRYSYVLNSPYKFTDPLGLIPETSNAPWCSTCFSGWGDYDEEQRIRKQQQQEENDNSNQQRRNYDIEQVDDWSLIMADRYLTELFTNENGFVRATSSVLANAFPSSHYRFNDEGGFTFTMHIYGDKDGNKSTEIYVPKEFDKIEYVAGSENSILATNSSTGEVLRISHVDVTSKKALAANKSLDQRNKFGSLFIANTGGKGGAAKGNVHSHVTFFGSKSDMEKALPAKYTPKNMVGESTTADYTIKEKPYLRDVRSLYKPRD